MTTLANICEGSKAPKNKPASVLSKKEILKKFSEMLETGLEDFIKNNEKDLHINEKAILMHLYHIYSGSMPTISLYAYNLVDFFTHVKVDFYQISSLQVKSYIENKRAKGQATATINNKLAIIKSFFSYIHKTGLISANPAITIKSLRNQTGKHEEKVLQTQEVEKVKEYAKHNCDARDYLLLAFLYATGVRVSEIISLKWKDMFQDVQGRWQARIIGKGNKERTVFIHNSLIENIMAFRKFQYGIEKYEQSPALEELPVFPNKRNLNKPLCSYSVYRIIKQIGELSLGHNKKISPHWLRHSFATHARLKEATLESIKHQLGHESYETTLKYEHSAHILNPAGKVLEDNF